MGRLGSLALISLLAALLSKADGQPRDSGAKGGGARPVSRGLTETLDVSLLCTTQFLAGLNRYQYSYTIKNVGYASPPFALFGIAPAGGVAAISSPPGWIGIRDYQGRASVAWAAIGTDDSQPYDLGSIEPPNTLMYSGMEVSGFSVEATGAPGLGTFYVVPYASPPVVTNELDIMEDPLASTGPTLWDAEFHGEALVPTGPATPTVEVDSVGGSGSARLESPRPNPATSRVGIAFSITKRSSVRIEVVDVAGRIVSVVASGTHEPGSHVLAWDGRDGGGRPAPAGVYFVRMSVNDTPVARHSVVRLR